MYTPWGKAQGIHHIAPGITEVSTASHGGIMLDRKHAAIIESVIGTGWTGSAAAWEEDCDWAAPYLLFESEMTNFESHARHGADVTRQNARDTLAGYAPDWLDRKSV